MCVHAAIRGPGKAFNTYGNYRPQDLQFVAGFGALHFWHFDGILRDIT